MQWPTCIFWANLTPFSLKAISDQPFFWIQGSLGEIVIDGFGGGARIYLPGGESGEETVVREFCKQGWDAGYAGEYSAFVAAVLDGAPLRGGEAESALRDLEVVVAMVAADEAHNWVATGPKI